jgi:hypothetical protein
MHKLAKDLQRWHQKRVGSVRDQLLVANEVILQLDIAQESRLLSDPELRLRRGLKMRVLGLASLERMIARQRARVAAVRDGDVATQFFRISAASRRRHNHIARLRNGDSVVEAQEEKEELAMAFFLEVLGSASPRTHDLSLANLGLAPLALDGLDATFSEDEVWGAVKSMPANKSPGPDGYSWEFYHACWPVVKGDILAALRAVFFWCRSTLWQAQRCLSDSAAEEGGCHQSEGFSAHQPRPFFCEARG